MVEQQVNSDLMRVLVVEDEPRLRDLLLDVIPDMGFTATAVRAAEEALRLVETEPCDIAILDLQLPGMGGMQLFERLKDRDPEVEVIILTAFGDLPTAQRAIQLGVVEFLSKPFHLGDLERALDRARRRRPRGGVERPTIEIEEQRSSAVTLAEMECQQILASLRRNNGNRTAAAQELGISRRMLHYRIAQYQAQGLMLD